MCTRQIEAGIEFAPPTDFHKYGVGRRGERCREGCECGFVCFFLAVGI